MKKIKTFDEKSIERNCKFVNLFDGNVNINNDKKNQHQ